MCLGLSFCRALWALACRSESRRVRVERDDMKERRHGYDDVIGENGRSRATGRAGAQERSVYAWKGGLCESGRRTYCWGEDQKVPTAIPRRCSQA